MAYVLKTSREDFLAKQRCVRCGSLVVATNALLVRLGSSSSTAFDQRRELEADIARYAAEIREYDETIRKATAARTTVQAQLDARRADLEALKQRGRASASSTTRSASIANGSTRIDYMKDFEWTAAMKANMKKYFGIQDFRLCQAGLAVHILSFMLFSLMSYFI